MHFKHHLTFFIFDCESIGLHGETFAVAGGVWRFDPKPQMLTEFCYSIDRGNAKGDISDRDWVEKNVPQITPTCVWDWELREEFWSKWTTCKQVYPGILMAVECGWPVETNFLSACVHQFIPKSTWGGPYPLHEIASIMASARMNPMHTYERLPEELPAHHPLGDARLSARLLGLALENLAHIERHGLPPTE